MLLLRALDQRGQRHPIGDHQPTAESQLAHSGGTPQLYFRSHSSSLVGPALQSVAESYIHALRI